MSRQTLERYFYLCVFSAFRIRTMGNTLCGSVVVIAIANAHTCTQDNTADNLSLRFLLSYKLRVANTVLRYNAELDALCRFWPLLAAHNNFAPGEAHRLLCK